MPNNKKEAHAQTHTHTSTSPPPKRCAFHFRDSGVLNLTDLSCWEWSGVERTGVRCKGLLGEKHISVCFVIAILKNKHQLLLRPLIVGRIINRKTTNLLSCIKGSCFRFAVLWRPTYELAMRMRANTTDLLLMVVEWCKFY